MDLFNDSLFKLKKKSEFLSGKFAQHDNLSYLSGNLNFDDMKKFLETLLKLLIPLLIPVIKKIINDELDKLLKRIEEMEIDVDGITPI